MQTAVNNAYTSESPKVSYVQPTDPWLTRRVVGSLEIVLGRNKVQSVYDQLKTNGYGPDEFFSQALAAMNITPVFDKAQLNKIPKEGPLVFVANHPYGVVDGLILCDLAMQVRGDFRILIHAMLCQDEDLAEHFLPIDFQPGKVALKNNIKSKKDALDCLSRDIPILIFPSGMVSTGDKLGFGKVNDAPWTTFAAKLIRDAQATVVPLYFHGRNSRKFHVASHIAEPLRMALLIHEALKKAGEEIYLRIGDPLAWSNLSQHETRQALTDFLYTQVQVLKY